MNEVIEKNHRSCSLLPVHKLCSQRTKDAHIDLSSHITDASSTAFASDDESEPRRSPRST
ncbi:hypothetical protein HPP92_023088 [Vanilla planifolia]|uniref:Uncharacterized protein n=1 Tax=Vanilla planifolia TaxID=51239 RepID=A0A835PWL3_VANPL|nr:hypothetical protein HPP92_023088 [Vanilla planifolia]